MWFAYKQLFIDHSCCLCLPIKFLPAPPSIPNPVLFDFRALPEKLWIQLNSWGLSNQSILQKVPGTLIIHLKYNNFKRRVSNPWTTTGSCHRLPVIHTSTMHLAKCPTDPFYHIECKHSSYIANDSNRHGFAGGVRCKATVREHVGVHI